MYYFTWAIIGFHLFGILDTIATFYLKTYSLSYREFYESFLNFCKTEHSIFSVEFKKT